MPARRFAATEQTIYRDLTATMRRLGATSLHVSRNILDTTTTSAEVVFDYDGRRYVVRCAKWAHYLDNLRAVERVIYYLYRAIDEYGVLTSQQQRDEAIAQVFGGFTALPDDTALLLGSGGSQWWEILGVTQQATKAEVINAYRALAHVHHPDVGGNADDFIQLRQAYADALSALGATS